VSTQNYRIPIYRDSQDAEKAYWLFLFSEFRTTVQTGYPTIVIFYTYAEFD